jgi:hypothetical protein
LGRVVERQLPSPRSMLVLLYAGATAHVNGTSTGDRWHAGRMSVE